MNLFEVKFRKFENFWCEFDFGERLWWFCCAFAMSCHIDFVHETHACQGVLLALLSECSKFFTYLCQQVKFIVAKNNPIFFFFGYVLKVKFIDALTSSKLFKKKRREVLVYFV